MTTFLNAAYWENRYRNGETGWDIGHPSRPLKEYIDQLTDPTIAILIPGGGNAYEAEYLFKKGFTNITVVDMAPAAKEAFLARVPDFPPAQFIVQDFFELQGSFDLVLEQTFFCALDPKLRPAYAQKMAQLLYPKGKLVGLLFNFPLTSGPPFGGSKEAYLKYFAPYFNIEVLEDCYNSIAPRQGREFFFKLTLPR